MGRPEGKTYMSSRDKIRSGYSNPAFLGAPYPGYLAIVALWPKGRP